MSHLLIIHITEFADSKIQGGKQGGKQRGKRAEQIKHENIGHLLKFTHAIV